MRELGFLVADKNMEMTIRGAFERKAWHLTFGCGSFVFDPQRDITVATGFNDPGLYMRGDMLLKPLARNCKHLVVLIDADWDGSPGVTQIGSQMRRHLEGTGWTEQNSLVLVLDPEVDIWLWSPSPHVASAFGWSSYPALQQALNENGWEFREGKPIRPKEAAEWALRQHRKPRSSAVYRAIAHKATLGKCTDPTFAQLLAALRMWYPST